MAKIGLPPEEPPEEYAEEGEEGAALPSSSEPETVTDYLLSKTPWWGISTAFHAALLVLLLFIVVSSTDDDRKIIVVAPLRPPAEELVMEKVELEQTENELQEEQVTEQPIYREVEEADHNETDEDQEYEEMQGESEDAVSDRPFQGVSFNDAIGTGGGAGGRFGGRFGGKRDLVARGGGGSQTEQAVLNGLKWLARHQMEDGRWSMEGFKNRCGVHGGASGNCDPTGLWRGIEAETRHNFDVGLTGLAVLAFLGAGYSHQSRDVWDGIRVGEVVRAGIEYLTTNQDAEGCVGDRTVEQYMYNHTIGALGLCEAYGITGSPRLRGPAQKAIDFIVSSQNPGRGWRYQARCGDNDSSVTGWAVMVLKSAEISGLTFPQDVYQGALAWFEEVVFEDQLAGTTGSRVWQAGYQTNQKMDVYIPGVNDTYLQHPAMTSIWIMCEAFIKHASSSRLESAAHALLADQPVTDAWEGDNKERVDFYYWYYASMALYQLDGPDGRLWKSWNQAMKDALCNNQNTGGGTCKHGSWEPLDRWSCKGGRVYATAINVLTLEVYYRYASAFGLRR